MTLRQYLIFMSAATLAAWFTFTLVLFFVDPQTGGAAGFLLFYGSLFLAILGTLSLLGLVIRMKIKLENLIISREVGNAFRQGLFFSFLFTSSLYLESKNLLVWWNVLLLIMALTILEFLFISYRRSS